MKSLIPMAASAAGGWLLSALGGWDVSLKLLVGAMAADYITGVIAAGVFHASDKTETGRLDSRAGFKGIMRKCCILLMVFLSVLVDAVTGAGFVRAAVCLFFAANEGLSIMENMGLMGVPCPEFLREMLETMKKRGESGEDEK